MIKIVHASIGETGHVSGNKPGDSTGKEVCVRDWWDKGWTQVLRHPNLAIAYKAANIGQLIADSNQCGYDQAKRNDLFKELQACDYSMTEFIKRGNKVSADCSSFVTACYICAGVKTLVYSSNAPTTSNMAQKFRDAGFVMLNSEKLLRSPDRLLKGDVLVKPGSHTVLVLEDGCGETVDDYYSPYLGKSTSIVMALTELGEMDTSKSHREKIYKANFDDRYTYSAAQNNRMLALLKQGRLKKAD